MTLTLYLSRVVAAYVVAATLVLTLLGLSLDLLKSAADLMAEGGARAILVYAALRAPLIMATLFPIAVLSGAVLAFLALGRRSEMVILRASGLGIFAALRRLAPLALLLGVIHSQLGDRIAPWAEQRLTRAFPASTDAGEAGDVIWSRSPGEVLTARLGRADGTRLIEPIFWRLDADGLITGKATARAATWTDGAWRLEGYAADPPDPEGAQGPTGWETRLTPASVRALAQDRLEVSITTAKEALAGTAVQTRGEAYYRTLIARSYAALAVPAVMLVLAAMASLGVERSGGGAIRAALSIAAGLVYVVLSGVLGTLSEVGAFNAVLASALPIALFATLGIWGLIVLEEP